MLSMRNSFPIFQMFILYTLSMRIRKLMRALSMRVRNWYVRWACESGTGACTEHTQQVCLHRAQSLQNMLSILIRNWCAPWAYGSGTDVHPDHTGQEMMHPEHLKQFLMRMLSISIKIPNLERSLQHKLSMRVRNWCVHWAYESGTDAHAQPAHQKLNDA